MIIFPITPYKSQSCLYAQKENASYTHLHGRLHNQKWNISAPSTGQNKRIVIYTLGQQNQCYGKPRRAEGRPVGEWPSQWRSLVLGCVEEQLGDTVDSKKPEQELRIGEGLPEVLVTPVSTETSKKIPHRRRKVSCMQ
ncbi:uncharacterized protein ACIBXB_022373 [Morphnus guianensis]